MTLGKTVVFSDELVTIGGTHDDEIILRPASGKLMNVQIAADARCRIQIAPPSGARRDELRVLFHMGERASVSVIHQRGEEKEPGDAATTILYEFHLADDVHLAMIIDSRSAASHTIDATFFLVGDRSSAIIKGAQEARDGQIKNLIIKQIHRGRHTVSSSLVHGVVSGRGAVSFKALIKIEPTAAHADAQQTSKHLLLSPSARAVAVPAIEVLNDQVRCKHGSAVSQLDPEIIFYLQSRGVAPQQAVTLVTHYFLSQPLSFAR